MNSLEIRQKFFDFFIQRGHKQEPSSSLIPAQDPTLLFTNAGMNQFKDLFLGKEQRSYSRATTIQKCVRAGGKHNDLDNVGFTKRHLTFFEMMGNFSFGDYFKKEAIGYAWDFLTKDMGLPIDKLHVSIFLDDNESFEIWEKNIGIPVEKIHRLGEAENFWRMGDTGPCGPCTEIHIDRGPDFGCKEQCSPACDCDRFLEIWNVVFMQFSQNNDGSMTPLERTGVDTGMGLERLCSVVQNKDSVFEIDLFEPLIKKIEQETGILYKSANYQTRAAFNVLLDHVRSSSLLIADGCAPSNEGRGYVLRKIIRRAALFAQKLTDKNIFPELSQTFINSMSSIYPELKTHEKLIIKLLSSEIEKFATNLIRGQHILQEYFANNKDSNVISGKQAFKLYDTFGFPQELIVLLAHEKEFTVDLEGFAHEMAKQKEQSGKKTTTGDELADIHLDKAITTEFVGYQELEKSSKIIALIHNGMLVDHVDTGEQCWIITQESPFFIEGGGQVADQGWMVINQMTVPIIGARKINHAITVHITAPTDLSVGMTVISRVNKELRTNAMKNHTATHLLQAALIQLFGKQIKQSGSLVTPDYLRFDFSYHENLSQDDLNRVEQLVNEKIRENSDVKIEHTNLQDAVDRNIIAFFGDKYNPENVRVVHVPNFSSELCGGTHVHRTGDIGFFKIVDMTALSAGHRRILALTGPAAIILGQENFDALKQLSQEFKVPQQEVVTAIEKQKEALKENSSQIKNLKKQLINLQIPIWLQQIETINSIPVLYLDCDSIYHEDLRDIATLLTHKKPGFYFLTSSSDTKNIFLCLVSPEYASAIDMKQFSSWLQTTHNLRGGGAKNSLQGGGVIPAELHKSIKNWIISL